MLAMCFILILNMYHGVVGNGKVETCARDTCAVRHRGRYGTCVRGRARPSPCSREMRVHSAERDRETESTLFLAKYTVSRNTIYTSTGRADPRPIYTLYILYWQLGYPTTVRTVQRSFNTRDKPCILLPCDFFVIHASYYAEPHT